MKGPCPDWSLVPPGPAVHNLVHCCWDESEGFRCLVQGRLAQLCSQLLLPTSSCTSRWLVIMPFASLFLFSQSLVIVTEHTFSNFSLPCIITLYSMCKKTNLKLYNDVISHLTCNLLGIRKNSSNYKYTPNQFNSHLFIQMLELVPSLTHQIAQTCSQFIFSMSIYCR